MASGGAKGFLRVGALTLAVAVVGVAFTVTFSLLTLEEHHRAQQHLLRQQVGEAASALAASLPQIQIELDDSLQVAQATGSPSAFQRFTSSRTSNGVTFSSVSLWRRAGASVQQLALVGARPVLSTDGRTAFLAGLGPAAAIRVTPILPAGDRTALGFADMPVGDAGLIVYAEVLLPPGRHLAPTRGSPFGDLRFALYLNSVTPENLLESSVPTPIRSSHAIATSPFGNASIVLVGTTTTNLTGALSAILPWVVLAAGLLLTATAVGMTDLLARRRRIAEDLAEENQLLYLEQRNIATTVQHALLPEVPKLEELEVGARYLPGTAGLDVGGDWYDVVAEPGRCTFVVGDVSGRGLAAATTMAALRFATRAYIGQGDGPGVILEKLGRLHEFEGDELFATVLIAEIDIPGRRLTLASAGHPPLLVAGGKGAWFVDAAAAPPIGVEPDAAAPTTKTVDVPEGSLLIAYTDGLVEQRDQSLSEGMEKLRNAAIDPSRPIGETLDRLIADLLPEGPVDDTALLGVKWRDRPSVSRPGSASRRRAAGAAPDPVPR